MIPVPEFITFTGIDDRTDLTHADEIARKYDIEWGILFSSSNRGSRYPSSEAVTEMLDIFGSKSAHLCGSLSCDVQDGNFTMMPYSAGSEYSQKFYRIQVNGGFVKFHNLTRLQDEFNSRIITQTQESEFTDTGHHQLFDCSAGKGVTPESIPKLCKEKMVGYAGGMGPDTVIDYLKKIQGEGRFWIDMENNVRTNGWFDLDKVESVCRAVYDF